MTKNKELNNEIIKGMAHRIREKDEIFDFDLARIFGYTTKSLNQQVRRNLDRFKEGSIFKLTGEESKYILGENSQNDVQGRKIATLNSGRGSNIKYYPYAFTIDGIDVLSTILYGDSIRDNYIKILNYFNKTNDIVDSENLAKIIDNLDNSLEIVRYENGEVSIDISVSPSEETVWLTQSDMATIFETTKQNISSHIQSIFESYKMLENSVVKKYLTTETVKNVITRASDGKEYNQGLQIHHLYISHIKIQVLHIVV